MYPISQNFQSSSRPTIMFHPKAPDPRLQNYQRSFESGINRNLADSHTGFRPSWRGPFGKLKFESVKGFGIDLNRNGRFDRGRDGVLTFDMNRDGKYDQKDVQSTNNMMKAASGNYDFNGDGKVSWIERAMGKKYKMMYRKLDRDRDGRLSGAEISRGGGRVWVDRDRNGQIGRGETHSVFRIPSPRWGGGSLRLDSVGPGWSRTGRSPFPGRLERPRPFPGPHMPHYPQPGPWNPLQPQYPRKDPREIFLGLNSRPAHNGY